ncbi:MAG: DNA repair protein RecN [Bacteroidetes bacterium]|nr:MAG: DNA repair protein RecN [Bacteroidota bacterium]
MLKSLLIENYALIEKLDISFDDGLTIITGETGAGKSILLGALGLILGQRADTRILYDQQRKCIIEGTFHVNQPGQKEIFQQNELDYEETSIFRREINPQGKSRAFINDTPVNLNVMKDIAERLIDIHSQHQNLLIGKSEFRYNIIDTFAGISSQIGRYRQDFEKLLQIRKNLEELKETERQTRSELDYLNFQYDELYKAGLNADEFSEIESELEILNHATEIKMSLDKADFFLQNSQENILSFLAEVLLQFRNLENYSSHYAELHNRLVSAEIDLKDIAREIVTLSEDVSDDPGRARELQNRYDLLQKLLHKHSAANIEELIRLRDEFKEKIDSFQSLEIEIQNLEKECMEWEEKLVVNAKKISEDRKKAIPPLEDEISGLLKELGMPKGQFRIQQLPIAHLTINGMDELNFLFSANPGTQPQELARIASGGELSRLMLAMKSVVSLKNLLPTIIFDEIDTGVSGEIGFKVGDILEKISNNMQVISVTHLPQVAAKGKKHFIVYKNTEDNFTKTLIKKVDDNDRVFEIAKMLGGEKPSQAVMQTAEELIHKKSIHKN